MVGVSAAAQVYQWRDSQGTVHFADNPPSYPADVTTLDADSGQPVVRRSSMRPSMRDVRGAASVEPSAASVSRPAMSTDSLRPATDGSSLGSEEASGLNDAGDGASRQRGFSLLGGRAWSSDATAQRHSILDAPSELNLGAPPVHGHLAASRSIEQPRGILDDGGGAPGADAFEDGEAVDGGGGTGPNLIRRRGAYSILIPSDAKPAVPTRRPRAASPR